MDEITSRIHLFGKNGQTILIVQARLHCQLMCLLAKLVGFRSDRESISTPHELYDRKDVKYSCDCM